MRPLKTNAKTCMQRMRDIVEHVYARALAKLKQSAIAKCCEVLVRQL